MTRDHRAVSATDRDRNAARVESLRRPDAPDVITVRQLAAILRTSTAAVYEGIHSRTLPFPIVRIGRSIRIPVKPMLVALGYEVEDADRCDGQP